MNDVRPKARMGRPPLPPEKVKVPLNLRILPEHRAAFDEAAALSGKTVCAWARDVLVAEVLRKQLR